MAATPAPDVMILPLAQLRDDANSIPAPSYDTFVAQFGKAFPKPTFLDSSLGTTAVYDFPPPSEPTAKVRNVLIVHGLNTPALGMWKLAKEIQANEPNSHVVTFDLWGHGLSSTPLVAHTTQIFHHQMMQVLLWKGWTSAHIFGFSFGGITTAKFALQNPWAVESLILMGTAGLMSKSAFSPQMQDLLAKPQGREKEAQECILDWLEGGPISLPEDWEGRSQKGEFIAEAVRKWLRDEHAGYSASCFSMFRDGNITGEEETFRRLFESSVKTAAVIGGADPVCSKQQLTELGLDAGSVAVIENADHSFVRTRARDTAAAVTNLWQSAQALSEDERLKKLRL